MENTISNQIGNNEITPQGGAGGCSCGAAAEPQHIYALGQITPRFPRLCIEKEYLQAVGRGALSIRPFRSA